MDYQKAQCSRQQNNGLRIKVANVFFILTIGTSALAQQPPQRDVEKYGEYVKKMLELTMQNPGMSIEEIKRKAEESVNGGSEAESAITGRDQNLVPESQLFKQTRKILIKDDQRRIDLKIPVNKGDVEVVDVDRQDTLITLNVFSSGSMDDAQRLSDSISVQNVGQGTVLTTSINAFFCVRYNINGNLRARGSCIHKVTIEKPVGSRMVVRTEKGERISQSDVVLTSEEALEYLSSVPSVDRMSTLKKYYQNSTFSFESHHIVAVLRLLSSLDRKNATQIMAQRNIELWPRDVADILGTLSSLDRLAVFRILAPKVSREYRLNLDYVIQQSGMFQSDQDQARRFLLQLMR
jgi:hypothetical protein